MGSPELIRYATKPLTADSEQPLPPALVRILRQAAILRLVLMLLAVGLYFTVRTDPSLPTWALVVFPLERTLFLGFVSSQRLAGKLKTWFLPVALGWLLVVPAVEPSVIALFARSGMRSVLVEIGIGDLGNSLIWLMVPVVLASWQYGYRGLRTSLAALVAEHFFLALILWTGAQPLHGFFVISGTRIAMLTLLGYIVTYLVNVQRNEHAALVNANRQLEQRAATVEQLAESRERNRLAREIHDTLAHSLTGLSLQLQALETVLEYDPQEAKTQLLEAETTVRSGINEARRAIQSLRASPLEHLGLSEALRQLCRAQEERTGAKFRCDIGNVSALDPLTEQAVYRVASAALANVEQHAAATAIAISLQELPNENGNRPMSRGLRLEVRDNGVGFDPNSAAADRFGLAGMAERAALIGGKLQIESAPGQGTRVELLTNLGQVG